MAQRLCKHTDVREFPDGLRTCLACGETRFREESLPDQAAAEDREYLYTDLRCLERGQTIRLVVLAPGNNNDSIQCTLVLSGVQHSDYDAISYTWATEDGDDSKTHSVNIDGSVLKVTQNCHAALRQVRHPERYERLWIDAICINQDNVKERNHQVGIMDLIYRTANQVHLCIIDPSHDYSVAFRWLSKARYQRLATYDESDVLETLYSCRYFTRVWIMQEIILAKAVVLHVNDDQTLLTNEKLRLFPATYMPNPLRARISPERFGSFHVQLKTSIQLSCSDPKDHIYGILSLLAPETRALIPVDYNLGVTQLYANVILILIEASQSLEMLAYAAQVVTAQSESVTGSFTIDQFHNYLSQGVTFSGFFGTWNMLSNWNRTTQLADARFVPRESCPQIWAVQPLLAEQQILTGFKVNIYSNQVCKNSEENDDFGITLDWPDICYIHEIPNPKSEDNCRQREFVREALNVYGPYCFRTSHGIGRSRLPALPGDRICFVDGMGIQLLLRRTGDCKYKIVSGCLWQPISREYRPPKNAELVELY